MRIVSWNMAASDRRGVSEESWRFLLKLEPDVALLQETVLPAGGIPGFRSVFTHAWNGKPWGSAILRRGGRLNLAWEDRSRGAVALATTELPGIGPVSLASIHARIIDRRIIPALTTTMDEVTARLRPRFIIGGDLNTARAAAMAWPSNGHGEFWESITTRWGLYEPLPPGGERQSFWREWLRNKPPTVGNSLQDDHVFVDERTSGFRMRCRIWDTKEARALSDHGPVVVDVAVPSDHSSVK